METEEGGGGRQWIQLIRKEPPPPSWLWEKQGGLEQTEKEMWWRALTRPHFPTSCQLHKKMFCQREKRPDSHQWKSNISPAPFLTTTPTETMFQSSEIQAILFTTPLWSSASFQLNHQVGVWDVQPAVLIPKGGRNEIKIQQPTSHWQQHELYCNRIWTQFPQFVCMTHVVATLISAMQNVNSQPEISLIPLA